MVSTHRSDVRLSTSHVLADPILVETVEFVTRPAGKASLPTSTYGKPSIFVVCGPQKGKITQISGERSRGKEVQVAKEG